MTEQSQQTVSSDAPPVPKLSFKPGGTGATGGEPKNPKNVDREPQPKNTSGGPQQVSSHRQRKEAEEARKKFQPKRYEGLSSKARKSIQLALAELSYIRRKAGLPSSIKHFIEESLTDWKKSPRSRLGFAPKDGEVIEPTEADPRQTFNNEIEEELKVELGDICHERGKVGHPVRTLIAILDDAFCQWLPKQEDLPPEYIDAVLQVSQKDEAVIS